ncbi:hypothetical protein [Nocardia carnea]|uniref:hypothetical protein n=1 Tax=Nocardia carnea TaxID=37328 RepID=UPI00245539FB|nr:hypothetical protein [Nocardia carnea]
MDTTDQRAPKNLARAGLSWVLLAAAAAAMAGAGAGAALDYNSDSPITAVFIGALPGVMAFVLAVGLIGFARIPAGGKTFAALTVGHSALIAIAFIAAYLPIRNFARQLGFEDGGDWGLPLIIYAVIVLSIIDLRRIGRTH